MAVPWKTIQRVPAREGVLELRQRGPTEFHITLGGLVLMNSSARRSEEALGQLACAGLGRHPAPRALVAGLGLGFTLRAMLDTLPSSAQVTVAELNQVVVDWCKGTLAPLTGSALSDARVTLEVTDVNAVIKRAANDESLRFDAIVLDLYTGPHARSDKRDDPFYGSLAIERMRRALRPAGVLAVWGEAHDAGYEKRLQQAGLTVTRQRPGHGGLRHVVYLAQAGS